MNPISELVSRYKYMFEGENIGISITRGWYKIFSDLCEAIDTELGADKQKFHWVQVKEKFGSARFYHRFGATKQQMRIDVISPDGVVSLKAASRPLSPKNKKQEIQKRIGEMISKAEGLTSDSCIICGESPADIDKSEGYMLVLCAEHSKVRKDITAKDIYFEE